MESPTSCYHGNSYVRESASCSLGSDRCIYQPIIIDIYRQATGYQSASATTTEKETDARLWEALQMEDPDLLIHLRGNNGRKGNKFASFWEKNEDLSQ